jgi:UDP-2-acetamido-2,6-beta-L-arabino-hexul-4-ose reductase
VVYEEGKMREVKVDVLDVKRDERGWVTEVLRREELVRHSEFGQFLVTTAHPGCVKGNHYHTRKYEWYCVLRGEARLVLVDNRSGECEEFIMSEHTPTTVRIPPHVTHAVENIGGEMMYLLVYTDEPYNINDPDTFSQKIV